MSEQQSANGKDKGQYDHLNNPLFFILFFALFPVGVVLGFILLPFRFLIALLLTIREGLRGELSEEKFAAQEEAYRQASDEAYQQALEQQAAYHHTTDEENQRQANDS